MNQQQLYKYLRSLPKNINADHTTLLTSDLPHFLSILGYSGSVIFYDFILSLSDGIRADALVARERTAKPHMIVEVKTWRAVFEFYAEIWKRIRISYGRFLDSDSQFLLLFSPKILGIATPSQDKLYDLVQITSDQASEIFGLLACPPRLRDADLQGSSPRPPEALA